MNWSDDELGRMKYLHAADDVFDTVPLWRRHFYNDYALEGAAYLAISASDRRTSGAWTTAASSGPSRPAARRLKDFDRLQMCGGFPWCIASIPIPSWAKKVFPDLPADQAQERLWDAIFAAVRITGAGGLCGAVAGAHRHAGAPGEKAQPDELQVPALHQFPGHGPDGGAAGGPHLGGRQRRDPRRPDLYRQHPHGGGVHLPPEDRRQRRGVLRPASEPQRHHHRQVPLHREGRGRSWRSARSRGRRP